jgi:hypothetical protein
LSLQLHLVLSQWLIEIWLDQLVSLSSEHIWSRESHFDIIGESALPIANMTRRGRIVIAPAQPSECLPSAAKVLSGLL